MAREIENKEQQHPREKKDGEIVERLLQESPTDNNLAEVARLRIRYGGFPGARNMQRNLDIVLERWELTEEELFESTRQIHSEGRAYKRNSNEEEQEDWT